jgi:hypothetical protein
MTDPSPPPQPIDAMVTTGRYPTESSEPEPKLLVHAEPLLEPKIGLRELWNNWTVRIVLIIFALILLFVVGIVVGLVVGLQNHDKNNTGTKDHDHQYFPPPLDNSTAFNSTYSNHARFNFTGKSNRRSDGGESWHLR